MVTVVLL